MIETFFKALTLPFVQYITRALIREEVCNHFIREDTLCIMKGEWKWDRGARTESTF